MCIRDRRPPGHALGDVAIEARGGDPTLQAEGPSDIQKVHLAGLERLDQGCRGHLVEGHGVRSDAQLASHLQCVDLPLCT
eukprot:2418457-Alexandrium_andersonii.AAC.1